MADSVVSFVLENLSQLIEHEAKLLCGVEDKVKSLERELKLINISLKSSSQNQPKKEMKREVLRQITDVAHEAEDVIDTFVVNVVSHRRRIWVPRMLHRVAHAKLLHHVSEKIDTIKKTMVEIRENESNYETQEAAGSSTDQELELLHKRRRNVEEDDVVGFQHDTTEVINLLKQGGSRRNVVSIIGMGGLGKTTLARKIYNTHVKKDFEYHAWVYVSNDYRPRELLHALLKCFVTISANSSRKHKKKSKSKGKPVVEDDSSFSEEELKDKVREFFKGKRYLVVLDDIWETQHWNDIQYAFPDDNKASRILITSRFEKVASHASSSPPYKLPFLNEEESWKLFSKRVFRGEDVPSNLELLGKPMVKSCGGLPISIVVLAGILANKEKTHREWSKVMGHVNSYLTQPETQVQDIVLKLSYDSLPLRLRPCFLYFGIFPEDYEIPVRRLIHLWVAEGFVHHSGSRIVEDVAEDYLDELIDRSLIQVGRRGRDGGIKTCRIHDLLRELCISESKEEKTFEVYRDVDNLEQPKPRRVSIQCNMFDFLASSKDLSGTRSVLNFYRVPYNYLNSSKSKQLVNRFPLVRVMDLALQIYGILGISTNLNMLVHLRYLRINLLPRVPERTVTSLPKFICNLWNLETLDLGPWNGIIEIPLRFPSGMWKLKRLRHLYTDSPIILPEFPNVEGETMRNLQSLAWVAVNKKSALGSLMGKGVFPKLRRLQLKGRLDDELKQVDPDKQIWENLRNLNYVNILKIAKYSDIPTSANAFPSNLTKLAISLTSLNGDVMNTLGSLTNLRILKLSHCYFVNSVSNLRCINGFPQLEVFQMTSLDDMERWELGKDVMPYLRCLIIKDCWNLTALPEKLWSLTSLREVQVIRPTQSVQEQLQSQPMRNGCNLIIRG